MQKTIVAATGNAHKLKEIRAILSDWNIISQREAGFHGEVEETGATFGENALIKAKAVCEATGLPALADDSGLCVEALGGAPGVFSARYSGGGDADNRKLLLKNLQGKAREAYFASAVALVFPDGETFTAEGKTHGRILFEETGENGFGYDSLFFSDDLNKSFGEAAEEEKNGVSHRGRALLSLAESLRGKI
ncbi:MAG: RdgB/HAM1 family non-canonical purine NTP pyrophosphatase [Clostridia bacterium]|nr:RdgB/HAM1 family non-canonical purine NTP pyrophosphatase [Clostridia bacterium]